MRLRFLGCGPSLVVARVIDQELSCQSCPTSPRSGKINTFKKLYSIKGSFDRIFRITSASYTFEMNKLYLISAYPVKEGEVVPPEYTTPWEDAIVVRLNGFFDPRIVYYYFLAWFGKSILNVGAYFFVIFLIIFDHFLPESVSGFLALLSILILAIFILYALYQLIKIFFIKIRKKPNPDSK
ncbi:MAG TPA: hypothetical protein VMW41_01070 [Candidatus Bathyarchaeia archaeon]|nr:hypothetical protein [Candidatus Bathyarchaeia archaeon]